MYTQMLLIRGHLACAPIQTASGELFEGGQRDAHTIVLSRQLHLCARHRMTVRARMALQQHSKAPVRNRDTIHGWSCTAAQTVRRPIIRYDGWGLSVYIIYYNNLIR